MAPDNHAEPPPDALPLADAFRAYTDPYNISGLHDLPLDGPLPAWQGREAAGQKRCFDDFFRRLAAGQLLAWGREGNPLGPIIPISRDIWLSARPLDWLRATIGDPDSGTVWFCCVVIASAAPAESDSLVATGRLPADPEAATRRWLEGLVRSGELPRKKVRCLREAQSRFGVTDQGFRRTWATVMNSTPGGEKWQKSGPRNS